MICCQTNTPTDSSSSHTEETEAKILVVKAPNHGVKLHPDIMPWLALGWSIRRVAPRVVEDGEAKCLVVLERSAEKESLPMVEETISPSPSRREQRERKRLESAAKRGAVKSRDQ